MAYKVQHKLTENVISGQAVVQAIKKSKSKYFKTLGYDSKSECVQDFKDLHFNGNLAEKENDDKDKKHYDRSIINVSAVEVCLVATKTVFCMIDRQDRATASLRYGQALKVTLQKPRYQMANQDVENLLHTKNNDDNQVNDNLVEIKVQEKTKEMKQELKNMKQQMKFQEQKLKQFIQSKASGGGIDQSLNVTSNGQASEGEQQNQQQSIKVKFQQRKQQHQQHSKKTKSPKKWKQRYKSSQIWQRRQRQKLQAEISNHCKQIEMAMKELEK